ncbi:MAG TPA: hypothetical protein VFE59_07885 [Trebonia sp.]|nr:hypothetical protein [Trebonia sp.]
MTASCLGSRASLTTRWRDRGVWCCAPARPESGRPAWAKSSPPRPPPGACRWRGLTNKQIGQALYVSGRTAENHVQHILVKYDAEEFYIR